jgi:hypothetical protein
MARGRPSGEMVYRRLEGNTLVLRQVEALLDQCRTVGAKPLKDYLEVKGYGQAAEWVYGRALTRPGESHRGCSASTTCSTEGIPARS